MRYGALMKREKEGYTLLELMVVLSILSVLLLVAVPRLTAMVEKSKEGSTKGNLAIIRSALQVYYADNEGGYPEDSLESLGGGKYLTAMPRANIYNTFPHPANSGVLRVSSLAALLPDTGGWAYVADRADPKWGAVLINCSHQDLSGYRWSEF